MEMDYEKEFASCLNQLVNTVNQETNTSKNGINLFKSFDHIYLPEERLKAIQKGLGYIYEVSKDEGVFNTFGNDIIQCFYDISRVSPEPIRRLAVDYLDVVKARWLNLLQTGYWKAKEIPNAQEVLDAAIVLYSLQCLSSDVHFGVELQNYVIADSSESKYSSKNKISVTDLFGWNAKEESIPMNIVDLCVKCHKRNPRRSVVCKYCGNDVVVISQYRALSNSLIYSFYCQMAGIELECSYNDYLQWLPSIRPYKSPEELPWKEFVDQCYLITHVVFTISQWGQLQLQIQQLPHEYLFITEYLPLLQNKQDVHLVGEFVECLRIFGVSDNSPLIMNGVHFLIEEQNKDGSWDNHMIEFNVDDAYVAYHATMVAVQAMIPSVFSGFGCMSEETEEIVSSWYKYEFLQCKPIPLPLKEPLKEIGVDFMKDPRLREMDDSLDRLFELTDCVVSSILDKENKMR